ncbi:MAG: M48 family metalloprotease [Sneathiella sp.]|nr:M48 family metalloprotease [Sneathiella sp.]
MIKRILLSFSIILVALFPAQVTFAKKSGLAFIRDAEIEHTLRAYASPLFTAAGLNAGDVSIHLINNRVINAFVAGGQRMFFFTGLLERVESPSQLKGVIAHETGHIAGSHLSRTQDALKNATVKNILGYILGAAAVFAGGGKAGAAVIGGAQGIAQKSFLKYNRAQESAADQASMRYLEATNSSGRGMLEFLEILGTNEQITVGKVDPYWRSHPISNDRISAMRNQVENSRFKDAPDTPLEIEALKRLQAKLYGFTRSLGQTLKKYPHSDQSTSGRYARAIAYFKYPNLEKAEVEINSLLDEFPGNPFFHELKGQMLFENGDPVSAVGPLKIAASYLPEEPLILTLYGTVLLNTGYAEDDAEAIHVLKASIFYDATRAGTWNQLAIAYSRAGDTGNLALATAERFLLLRQRKKAIFHAKRVQQYMRVGTPGFLRADDIISLATRLKKPN